MTTKKKPTKKPKVIILGAPSYCDNLFAVWFELLDNGRPDLETVETAPVVSLVTYKYKNETRVGGMVCGPGGLYLAEIEDEDFRCYSPEEHATAVAKQIELWEEDVFDDLGEDEDEEDDDFEDDDDSDDEE